MKELIKKILREEVQKRFVKSSQNIERAIIKHMESLISETTRIVPPPEDNYGNFAEEWCKGDNMIIEARYYMFSEDSDEEKFVDGTLFVNKNEVEFLSKMLQVRKVFILNVITEWYDEKYATKFGQETGHPEFEIDDTDTYEGEWRKCSQIVDTDNLSREYMIDYIDTQTLHKASELEKMSDEKLKSTYKRVYNIQLNN
jgi:hypothetical protein